MSFGVAVNRNVYDHSSVEIALNGVLYDGISEISWSQTLQPGIQRGTSAMKHGRSRGEYNAEGSFTVYVEQMKQIRQALAGLGLGGYGEAVFDITVTMFEVGGIPSVAELRGCRITSDEFSSGTGGDVAMQTVQIDIMQVIVDGVSMVSPPGT